jgi:small conductance mechanosensitive channel
MRSSTTPFHFNRSIALAVQVASIVVVTTCMIAHGALASTLPAQSKPSTNEGSLNATVSPNQSAAKLPDDQPAAPAQDDPSDAEQIAGLQRTIEAQEMRLKMLEAELANPESEYAQAEGEFQELDRDLKEKREVAQELRQQGKQVEAAALEKEFKSIEKQWHLAKGRFELAIEERKTLREEITTLKMKVQKDRAALDELTGAAEPKNSREGDDSSSDAMDATTQSTKSDRDYAEGSAPNSGASEKDRSKMNGDDAEESEEQVDEELMKAEAEEKHKEDEAEEAQEEAQAIGARISDLQKIITQEQKGLTLARKQADLALETQRALEEELQQQQAAGASADELQELRQRIADTKQRYTNARDEVAASTDRMSDNQSELASLRLQQIDALQDAEKTRLEANAAQEAVEELRNPFAPRNVLKWLIDHGPKVVMYLIAMIALLHSAKLFSHRIVKLMAGATGRGTTIERENRAKTLVGVFQNAASVTIVIGGTLVILDEMGAKISVLLGGVAVFGLAVAFGAQNLMKDYFYGFVMLLENQYMIHDVVKIGDLSGQVERITLRMTVLRDGNGVVHFIPNGQINCVSNETHGWSRASFEIGVAYKENIDHVMSVLADLTRQLRADPKLGPTILEDATEPGIESLGDSAVVIKFHIKTRPHQHGAVKRELLRRIKNRFDELGIELPFPHRTVYHRHESAVVSADSVNGLKKCA